MSLTKKVLIGFVAVAVIAGALLFLTFKKFMTPTTGPKINTYAKPSRALLVIDVQEDFSGLKDKQPLYKNVEQQIEIINKLIDKASRSGFQVVYIRHLYPNNLLTRRLIGRDIEGMPGTELDARIKVISKNDITKKKSDAFSNPQLDEFLINNRVNELYLVGLDAAYCVYNTAMGGINRGYKVTIIKDAVMTLKDMNDVLKKYEKDGIGTMVSKDML